MTPQARMFVAGLGVLLLLFVLRSLRAQKLRFEYSLLWILLSLVVVVLAVFQQWADRVANWVGIDYPPAFYLLLCLFIVMLILFDQTRKLSSLDERMKTLTQMIALMDADRGSENAPTSAKETAPEEDA